MENTDKELDKIEARLSSDVQEEFQGSTMSKAGRLAMELNKERKRLKEEMEVLQIALELLTTHS